MVGIVKCICILMFAHAAAAFQPILLPSFRCGRAAAAAAPRLAAGLRATTGTNDRVKLAGGLEISPIGVGAWSWGDRLFWGYDDSQEVAAQDAFNTAVDLGVTLFDTAEVYGASSDPSSWGYSEVLCGRFARQYEGPSQNEIMVATKFAPLPHRFLGSRQAVSKALRASLQRLGTDKADLYQLHWPGFFADAGFWDGLADAYQAGLVRSVGVSNYSQKRLRAVHKALGERGVPLATNQVGKERRAFTQTTNCLPQACQHL
jgi:pyridoxine 4-dehydrogenase